MLSGDHAGWWLRTGRVGFVGGQAGTFSEAALGRLGGDDPSDFWDARHAFGLDGRSLEPLEHLAIAVVDKSLRDWRMYARTSHPIRRVWWENARAFLFDPDVDADWPFTLERICERFNLDVEAVRDAIRRRQGSARRVRLRARRAA